MKRLLEMFEIAHIDRDKMIGCLLQMGRKHVKGSEMKAQWSENNPTRNYCYVVSEFVYWYVAPMGVVPYAVAIPGDPGPHRYLRWPAGEIVDLTCDQFADYNVVDYSKGKPKYFMQTGVKGPSARARLLATLMGHAEDAWKERLKIATLC
jgi:hypothetical protein